MTASEKMERMERCDNCVNGECLLDGYPPFDCGYCNAFVDSTVNGGNEDDEMDAKGVKIYVPAGELWDFYVENSERCAEEMVLIAENTETGYAVYMTEEDGNIMFSVCKGEEEPEYEEYATNDDDCETTAKKLFLRYLFPVIIVDGRTVPQEEDLPDGMQSLSRQDVEDEIYEREDELFMALQDFLAVVLQEKEDGLTVADFYGDDMVEEVLDHFLAYLAKEMCLEIYRPMFKLDEETGSEIYTQYPYEKDNGEEDIDDKGGAEE